MVLDGCWLIVGGTFVGILCICFDSYFQLRGQEYDFDKPLSVSRIGGDVFATEFNRWLTWWNWSVAGQREHRLDDCSLWLVRCHDVICTIVVRELMQTSPNGDLFAFGWVRFASTRKHSDGTSLC